MIEAFLKGYLEQSRLYNLNYFFCGFNKGRPSQDIDLHLHGSLYSCKKRSLLTIRIWIIRARLICSNIFIAKLVCVALLTYIKIWIWKHELNSLALVCPTSHLEASLWMSLNIPELHHYRLKKFQICLFNWLFTFALKKRFRIA